MTYTELLADVATWLNRTDMTAVIPSFVRLAEEKMNRALRVRSMEIALAESPITDNRITLAADVVDVKSLWVPGYEGTPLNAQSFDAVLSNGLTGIPALYAHQGGDLFFDGGGSVQGVLYQKIAALETASTNWLSEKAPSVYLFGSLVQAAIYTRADPSVWQASYQQALDELTANENRLTGPLVARAR
jgi:hypothetical protein